MNSPTAQLFEKAQKEVSDLNFLYAVLATCMIPSYDSDLPADET